VLGEITVMPSTAERIEIAEKQAGADDADDTENAAGFLAAGDPAGECHEGERAALAIIIGAHDEGDVFEGHDDHQRPENQRENAENIVVFQA
jgi:hypothetical protein